MPSFSFRARPGAKIQVFQTSSGMRLCMEDYGVATIDSNYDLDIELNFTTNELSLLVIPADFSERILEAINPVLNRPNVLNCYNFGSECHESPPNYTNMPQDGPDISITSSYQDTVLETSVSRLPSSPTISSVGYSPQGLTTANSHAYTFKFPEMDPFVCNYFQSSQGNTSPLVEVPAPSTPSNQIFTIVGPNLKSLQFPCRMCDRSFTREYTRKLHEDAHAARAAGPLPCREINCRKTFSRSHDRSRHEVRIHGHKNYTCEICNSIFSSPRSFQKHKCKGL